MEGADEAPVADLLDRARILMSKDVGMGAGASAGAVTRGVVKSARQGPIKCWECGGPHPVRYCKKRDSKIKCYKCGGPHIVKYCPEEDPQAAGCQVEVVRGVLNRVPVIEVAVGGQRRLALVDTGCLTSMVRRKVTTGDGLEASVLAFDGREVKCYGYDQMRVGIGEKEVDVRMRVIETLLGGVDMILGMDVIDKLGGVTVLEGKLSFGDSDTGVCAMVPVKETQPDIVDDDFDGWFDGKEWCVRYKWNKLGEPSLRNTVGQYKSKLSPEKEEAFDAKWKGGLLKAYCCLGVGR